MQQVLCCGHTSARVDILCRYVKFFHSLRRSASEEVQVLSRLMARNIQSGTRKNLQYIAEVSGLNPWNASPAKLKAALAAEESIMVPQQDRWRVPYLCSLLSQRGEAHNLALEEEEEQFTELIDSLVRN